MPSSETNFQVSGVIRLATYENLESTVSDAMIVSTGIPRIGESAAAVPAGSVISLGSTVTLRAITVVAIGTPSLSVKFPRNAGKVNVCNLEFCAVAASSGPRTI